MNSMNLSSLLTFTRDGEWGQNKAGPGLVEMRVIRGTDFKNIQIGDISTLPVRYIPENAASRKILQPNDILFETAGGTKDQPTGRSVFLPKKIFSLSKIPLICASFSRFLRVDSEKIDPYFLYLYLNYIYNKRIIYKYHVQHTGVARFQFTQFTKEQNIPIFNTHQQRAISSIFSVLDDKIELNRRTNETLEAMARALFRDWFVDFGPTRAKMAGEAPYLAPELWELFPDGLDEEGKPEGWKTEPLDETATFLNGLALQKYPATGDTSLPAIKIAQLRSENTETADPVSPDIPDDYIVEQNDLLFSWSGSLLCKFWNGQRGALNQHLFKVTSKRFEPWFIYEWIQFYMPEFQAIAAAKATTMGHIQRRHLTESLVTIPPSNIVLAANKSIGSLIEQIQSHNGQSHTLTHLRDLLLPKLMSGEISIRDAEKMVEDAA
ncbi:restriction endonuclease subunit S [Acetobacter lambici]|uniref:Restriction endonuclease subunit S n=1 Tax=Acetobacter lambici TaxID=1332824 RepID=A0ABT1F0N5_9PROT|nr:restriction endonuclease subunit S [Acetobacter lambici]MCP1242551.1 restriction endonuclease subunit S [Acetobacter lambici]MCP1258772.1 restriction endonuclease subunit S [Acetobacter lambici]NHO56981.1 restriction endonuclease subunit S [Acetobacter lambici]